MILSKDEQVFIKGNRKILNDIFSKRIDELKENMILEEDEKKRDKIRNLIIEFKYWLMDIRIFSDEKEVKKDNFT